MTLTKKDLEAIEQVVENKTAPILQEMRTDFLLVQNDIREIKNDLAGLREQIQELTTTLDKFVKIMTDYKEEFTLLKAEVDQINNRTASSAVCGY